MKMPSVYTSAVQHSTQAPNSHSFLNIRHQEH